MWDNLIETKQVYVYELSDTKFKEAKATLKLYGAQKPIAIDTKNSDKSTVYKLSTEEYKVHGNYLWMEKRCKERAAEIFTNYLKAQQTKQQAALNTTESRLKLISKYYEGKK